MPVMHLDPELYINYQNSNIIISFSWETPLRILWPKYQPHAALNRF